MNESGLEQQDAQIAATGYKKFARDIGLAGITNLLVNFSGLITLPIVSKNLGAYGYGIWGQLTIILTLVSPLTTLGLLSAMIRFMAGEKNRNEIQNNVSSLSLFVLGTSLIVGAILVLLSDVIGDALFDGNGHLIRLLAIAIPFQSLLSIFINYFRTFRQMKRWAVFTLLNVYGQAGLIAFFILSGYGLDGMAYALVATKGGLCILAGLVILPAIGIARPRFPNFRNQLKYGLPLIPQTLSAWIVNVSDRWVIGLFLGPSPVAYYLAPYALGEFVRMFFFPLGLMLTPVLTRLYEENKRAEIETYLRYSLKFFIMLAIPSAVGLSLLAKPLLAILSTPEIAKNGITITPLISLGIILHSISFIFQQPLLLAKKTNYIAGIWIAAAVLNLGLNFALVPTMGILGAAITTALAFAVVLVITVYFSSRIVRISIDFPFILKSLAASAGMGLVIWWVNPLRIWYIILMVLAGAAIYFGILILLKSITRGELDFFKKLFQR